MSPLISKMIFAVYRALPPDIRYKLKNIAGANGHAVSTLDHLKGMRDADGKKRLDRSFLTVAAALRNAKITSLEGLRCMEVGAGFVPTDALCFFLMGAESTLATDYNRILQFDALRHAIMTADIQSLESEAFEFIDPNTFRQRLLLLRNACAGGESGLASIGIHYQAPIDLTQDQSARSFDFIYSVSVFEHISPSQAPKILANLVKSLTPSGCMVNDIHLEDHFDMIADPFEFLRIDSHYSAERDVDARGNRLRFSDWKAIFDNLPHSTTEIVSKRVRPDCRPPVEALLAQFAILDPDDCFTARIISSTKRA